MNKIEVIIGTEEAARMNKTLGKYLNYNTGLYFLVMLLFAVAAAILGNYALAGIELAITIALFAFYLMYRTRRRAELQSFLQQAEDKMSTVHSILLHRKME